MFLLLDNIAIWYNKAMLKKINRKRNFWTEPLFWFLIGACLLSYSGEILRRLGFVISEQEVASIAGWTVILAIAGFVFFVAIKNYKVVLMLLAIIVIIGLFFGAVSWFFALPATTIIIILLILLLLK